MDKHDYPTSYFSVGPIKGHPSVLDPDTGNTYVSQRAPARDDRYPDRPLGRCRVVVRAEDFWGGDWSSDYVGPVLENPTWAKIKGEHTRAIRKTRDFHHIFLEGIHVKPGPDGIAIITLCLGS